MPATEINLPADTAPAAGSTSGPLVQVLTRWRWLLWAAFAGLIYYPLFQTQPIFDDIAHVEFAASHGWDVLHMGPIFFRPFERALIGINWMWSGKNFWLVRSVALIALTLKAALVYSLTRRLAVRSAPWIPWLAALIFLA